MVLDSNLETILNFLLIIKTILNTNIFFLIYKIVFNLVK